MINPLVKRWLFRLLFLAVIILFACALHFLGSVIDKGQTVGIDYDDSQIAGVVKILSPHWEGVRNEFTRGYNHWRIKNNLKPIRIEWLDVGGTSDIVKFINSAFISTPNSIDIDIFFGGGTDPYFGLHQKGLLQKVVMPESIMTNIPPDIHGLPLFQPDGYWYAAAMSGFGILYNKDVCKRFNLPIPQSWDDLTRPELRSWVGSADPRKSGSSHMMYEIILQAYGWEKGMQIIAAMAGNIRGFTASASTVPKDIAVGEIAAGLCIDVYAWSTIQEVGSERLGFILPKGYTVVNGDAIAMLKGAPQAALAKDFIRFVLSEDGQKIWMLKKGSMEGAPTDFELDKLPVWPSLYKKYQDFSIFSDSPFDWPTAIKYDFQLGSLRWRILNDYIGKIYIESHPECKKAWQKVCHLSNDEPMKKLYLKQIMTEAQMVNDATNSYKNESWRADTVSKWGNDARRRYKEICK